jgi:hypothetical protein
LIPTISVCCLILLPNVSLCEIEHVPSWPVNGCSFLPLILDILLGIDTALQLLSNVVKFFLMSMKETYGHGRHRLLMEFLVSSRH